MIGCEDRQFDTKCTPNSCSLKHHFEAVSLTDDSLQSIACHWSYTNRTQCDYKVN